MRQFDVHAPVCGIIQASLHGEQIHPVGSEHDVVDASHSTSVGRNSQRHRGVVQVLLPMQLRHPIDALSDLVIQRVVRMRRFGKERPAPGIVQCRQRALADYAVDVQTMGALEGFDGVAGVGAEGSVGGQNVALEVAVPKDGKRSLEIVYTMPRFIQARRTNHSGLLICCPPYRGGHVLEARCSEPTVRECLNQARGQQGLPLS